MPVTQATLDLVDLIDVDAALQRRMQLILDSALERKVIVVINGKGGVGKSSVSVALAYDLSQSGQKVLLIEMDEQGNNCEDLGLTGGPLDDNGKAQADAILNGTPLVPTGEARPGLFVVPGGAELESVVEELYVQRRFASYEEDETAATTWMGMYAAAIDAVRDDYDVIILDVAPGSEVLQLQALVTGEMVVIPSKSDPSSRKGLRTVARRFGQARVLNPALTLLGVVLFATNTSATKVIENIKMNLEKDLNGAAPVFRQSIRHVEAAAVACRVRGIVPQEADESTGLDRSTLRSVQSLASDYRSLGMEFLQAVAANKKEYEAA